MIDKAQQTVKHVIDGGLGSAGISVPLWWSMFEPVVQAFLLIGGAALLALRIMITYREWRNK